MAASCNLFKLSLSSTSFPQKPKSIQLTILHLHIQYDIVKHEPFRYIQLQYLIIFHIALD